MSRILAYVFTKQSINVRTIITRYLYDTSTKPIFDVEKYECEQSQKIALNLGFDEIELRKNIEKHENINHYDNDKIANNPYCCGLCGNCSY